MIILSQIDVSRIVEKIGRRDIKYQNLKCAKNAFIQFWHDDSYGLAQSNENLNAVSGRYYINMPVVENRFNSGAGYVDDLMYAVGSFMCIQANEKSLTIATSLYRPSTVFYTEIDGRYIFSSCIKILLEARKCYSFDTEIDLEYCTSVVAGTYGYGEATVFSQIKRLQAGERLSINQSEGLRKYFYNLPQKQTIDIASTIKENLRRIISDKERIFLMMSDGLDSGFLFCLLSETALEFVPVHRGAQSSLRESEFADALSLANELGKELYVVSDDNASSLSGQGLILNTMSDLISDKCGFFITGYGGDQVFLQNPQRNISFDAYCEGGFAAALKSTRDYCWLKKENFYSTLWYLLKILIKPKDACHNVTNCPDWFHPGGKLSHYSKHYLLQEIDPRSAKYSHVRSIISACMSKREVVDGHTTHHPFLMQNVIGSLIEQSVCNLFSADYDRIMLRQELHTKYGKNIAWRITKKPSSSSVMNEISQKADFLKSVISNSFLGNKGIVNVDRLYSKIDECSTVRLPDDFDSISRLLRIEIEINIYKDIFV